MSISKEKALRTIKLSLVETQYRIRRELDVPSMRQINHLQTTRNRQLKENQAVLDLINFELMKIVDHPNTLTKTGKTEPTDQINLLS